MDKRIKAHLESIKDEVSVLMSGLPSDDETTKKRLSRITNAAEDARDIIRMDEIAAHAALAGVGDAAGRIAAGQNDPPANDPPAAAAQLIPTDPPPNDPAPQTAEEPVVEEPANDPPANDPPAAAETSAATLDDARAAVEETVAAEAAKQPYRTPGEHKKGGRR